MPSLIDLRRRIRSVKSTQQVTQAMKMISAARLRKAQDRVLAARPYATVFREMLGDVASAVAGDERAGAQPLLERRPEQRILLLLFTADRGLAGAFNTNLIRTARQFMNEHAGARIELTTIGRKGRDFFRKNGGQIVLERVGATQAPTYELAQEVASDAIARFSEPSVDAVYLLYNEFKSVVAQKVTLVRALPVEVPEQRGVRDYIFEQPPAELLAGLLPRYVGIMAYQAMLETAAAEHAARMTAMEAATSNAGEMIEKLTLYMNRVRQASITKELIEVVSGAAAAM